MHIITATTLPSDRLSLFLQHTTNATIINIAFYHSFSGVNTFCLWNDKMFSTVRRFLWQGELHLMLPCYEHSSAQPSSSLAIDSPSLSMTSVKLMPAFFRTNLRRFPILKPTETSCQYMLWNQAEADVETQKLFSHELSRFSMS